MEKEKHHSGLFTLFFAEMWERFSYYGMRALMVLYLVKHHQFSDEKAGIVYGVYTSMVYLTPLPGGFLGDRVIGPLKAIYVGGMLMMLGHLSLAMDNMSSFYIGLALLVLGNGLFKPNMSSLVGKLYIDRPWMKDSAYTYYYMGINIGGSFGPLLCGYIGEKYGWHLGFGLAAIGMLLGLLQFKWGESRLGEIHKSSLYTNVEWKLFPEEGFTSVEKDKMIFIGILAVLSILFWVPYEQMGSSVNLYTDRIVDRMILGEEIPASTFQSINGFLILAFAPLAAWFWNYRHSMNKEISIPMKFFLAFVFLGLSYACLALSDMNRLDGKSSVYGLLVYYVFLTIGELCISPVGLSTVSTLAPEKVVGLLMGIWFLSNAISHYISGWLSGAYTKWMSIEQFFMSFVISSVLAALLLLFVNKKMNVLLRRGEEKKL
jgi:POT family proton-dependent oligopeptide transporter